MKTKKIKIKAWGITNGGNPVINLQVDRKKVFGYVTEDKNKAYKIAKDWSEALDDDYKIVPCTITYEIPIK